MNVRQTVKPITGGVAVALATVLVAWSPRAAAGGSSSKEAPHHRGGGSMSKEMPAEHGRVQTRCPVSGKALEGKGKYVDVKGKRVYVCCPGCIGKIKADPDKYLKKLAAQGVELEAAGHAQATCPVSGEALEGKGKYVDVKGKRVYVCCPGCIGKIKADPDKYLKKLTDAGVKLEDAR